MSVTAIQNKTGQVPQGMSADEWALRCDLAAVYQLSDMYGFSDMAGSHISARVPGPEHHFLLNPFGMFFDEITASSLIKVDLKGQLVGPGNPEELNPAGFVIHSAVHVACPELVCVMHSHLRSVTAVGMQKDGLLPISQKALLMWDLVRYHDFEGAALNMDERERIVQSLGPTGRAMFLRNHGALTVGATCAEAFCYMYRLDIACKYQIDALAGGRDLNWLQPPTVKHTAAQGAKILAKGGFAECGKLEWKALLRKLEREKGTSWRT